MRLRIESDGKPEELQRAHPPPSRWPITANSMQTRCHVSNEYASDATAADGTQKEKEEESPRHARAKAALIYRRGITLSRVYFTVTALFINPRISG